MTGVLPFLPSLIRFRAPAAAGILSALAAAATALPEGVTTMNRTEFASSVSGEVSASPADAAAIAVSYINSGHPSTRSLTPIVVSRTIRALPEPADVNRVADVVYRAVKALPEAVLDIVRAATAAAPHAAEEIVEAAISAVDDPWIEVLYTPMPPGSFDGDEVSADGKTAYDGKSLPDGKSLYDDKSSLPPGTRMPLAEAIVEAASESAPGLDKASLVSAADRAIRGTPSAKIRALSDPKVVSPVGDAGRTNFGNEPRRPINSPVSP